MAILQPKTPDQTAADASDAAATARKGPAVTSLSIDYASPANATPESQVGCIGDQLFGSKVSSLLTGGSELTVIPTEDPEDVYRAFKLSPDLSPIIDALTVNVYGAGYTFTPVVETGRPDFAEKVRSALQYEQAVSAGSFEHSSSIEDDAVEAEMERIQVRINNEEQFLRAWFERCCPGTTFQQLSVLLGQDKEVQGDAYTEVLRDVAGYPSKIIWAPAWSIRAKPLGEELIPVNVPVPISAFRWTTEVQYLRFRSYVQIDTTGIIVARYKQYGDPRCMSRKSGRYYWTLEDMLAVRDEWTDLGEGQLVPPQAATEMLHFELPNPLGTAYGKPAHTGIFPNLDGARDLEEENRTLIIDRVVPQMFILVSGGAGIKPKDIEALENRIKQNAQQGKKSIHILQARSEKTAAGTFSPTPTMEIVKTKSEQHQDALGLKYLEHSAKKVRHAYRLPRAALGQHDDLKEDEAPASYRFAEAQVYDFRRDLHDDVMNSTLIRDLGIQLVRYHTRSRTPKEPNELAEIINKLMTAGVLTPDEGRALAGDIFNREFKDLVGIWSRLPTKLLTAMLQTKNQLVAAALLGSETESDIIERLQAALVSQLSQSAKVNPAAEKQQATFTEVAGGKQSSKVSDDKESSSESGS
jgi:capsid portal protein